MDTDRLNYERPNENGDGFTSVTRSASEGDLDFELALEPSTEVDDVANRMLGRFELRSLLGSGGFGSVYLAFDTVLNREVAVKLPKALTEKQRSQFLIEARAVSNLQHPSIVTLYDFGESDGVYYLAMQYCRGCTLGDWMRRRGTPVPVRQSAEIVRKLADAVEHAHRNGVLHRDINPLNVLVADHDRDSEDLNPRLTDFGIARFLEGDSEQSPVRAGTPRYMSPEQATGNLEQVGPACDVFSLGVLLFELLTTRTPVVGSSSAETLRRLAHDPIPSPRQFVGGIPKDLEAVCLKCLEKKPEDRYASAAELAEDLKRFLDGMATRARPLSLVERAFRWSRREPAAVTIILLVLVSVIIAGWGGAYHLRRLKRVNRQLDLAFAESEAARHRMSQLLYCTDVKLAAQAWTENDIKQMLGLLNRHLPTQHGPDPRGFEWYLLQQRAQAETSSLKIIHDNDGDIYNVCYSPKGHLLVTAGKDGLVRAYEARGTRLLWTLKPEQGEINGVACSRDGTLLATSGDDGRVRLWDAQSLEPKVSINAHASRAHLSVFMPDGRTLISCGNEPDIGVFDVGTGERIGVLAGHTGAVENIVLSRNGKFLVSASSDQTTRVWNLEERECIWDVRRTNRFTSVSFSPDSEWFVAGCLDGTVELWNRQGEHGANLKHFDGVQSVMFSPTGDRLATADRGGSVRLWRIRPSSVGGAVHVVLERTWQAHQGRIWSISFSKDGSRLVSVGSQGDCKIWSLEDGRSNEIRDDYGGYVDQIACVEPQSLISLNRNYLSKWDATNHRVKSRQRLKDSEWMALATNPKADLIAIGDSRGTIALHQLSSLEFVRSWHGKKDEKIFWLAFAGDDLLFALSQHQFVALDLATAELATGFPSASHDAAACSDDGEYLAIGVPNSNHIELWHVPTRKLLRKLRGHVSTVTSLAFAPDNRILFSGSDDRSIKAWDLTTGELRGNLLGHRGRVRTLGVSGDGRTLASVESSIPHHVKLWNIETNTHLCDLFTAHTEYYKQLQFAPGARRLYAVSDDNRLFLLAAEPAVVDSAAGVGAGETTEAVLTVDRLSVASRGYRGPLSAPRNPLSKGSDGNVVINGGAEDGYGGWESRNGIPRIGSYGLSGFPARPYGVKGELDGEMLFCGGDQHEGTLRQVYRFSESLERRIGETGAHFTLGAYLGGYKKQEDRARIRLIWHGTDGSSTETVLSGASPTERAGRTRMMWLQTTEPVPAGAFQVEVLLEFFRYTGKHNDGMVDEVFLAFHPPSG